MALAEQHKPQGEDKICPMTLNGITYTEKADAGQMLLAVCKENTSPQPVPIGSYRGFRMEVYYDTLYTEYRLNLCGKAKHQITLGSDALGNLTRIENELAKLPAKLTAAKTKREETISQLGNAKVEVQKPFAFENELKDKTDRLNALNIELNLMKKTRLRLTPSQSKPRNSPKENVQIGSDNCIRTFEIPSFGLYNWYNKIKSEVNKCFEDSSFETFVDAQDSAFAEYISSIVYNLSKSNPEYRAVKEKIDGICERYPAVMAVLDREKPSNLTEQECKALIDIMEMKNKLHDMELDAIYFRGAMTVWVS